MQKTKIFLFRLCRYLYVPVLLACLPLCAFSQYAYLKIDSSLLTVDRGATPTNKQVAVFPDILKGNETASMEYISRFSERRRDYLIRMYNQGKKLLPKAAGILRRFNLPEELRVLMILESAYNPHAVSRAGAVGYWQFMDAVAREYGLRYIPRQTAEQKKNAYSRVNRKNKKALIAVQKKKPSTLQDDRTHFVKSTQAAARYLCDRKRNLDGNWLLVVASYNCGVGNVWEAMERCGKENPDFWDIKKYLPAETQAYVMNFITLTVIYHNYDSFLKGTLDFMLPGTDTEPCEAELPEPASTASCLPGIQL